MKLALIFTTVFFSASLLAGECVLNVDRTACPGKETEALKPYNGKNPTTEKKAAADLAACTKQAEKAAKIVRKGTLSAKKVTATFDGAAVPGDYADKSECK